MFFIGAWLKSTPPTALLLFFLLLFSSEVNVLFNLGNQFYDNNHIFLWNIRTRRSRNKRYPTALSKNISFYDDFWNLSVKTNVKILTITWKLDLSINVLVLQWKKFTSVGSIGSCYLLLYTWFLKLLGVELCTISMFI